MRGPDGRRQHRFGHDIDRGRQSLPTGTEIHATLKAKTSGVVEGTFGLSQNTCTQTTALGATTNETGASIEGSTKVLTLENCTRPTKVLSDGSLSIAWTEGRNGTVTGTGSEIESETPTGVCVYGDGAATKLGTLKGVASTAEHATMVVNSVLPLIKTVSGSCVSDIRWTAEYTVTSPAGLTVQQ